MIVACQVMDPGSIPGERILFFLCKKKDGSQESVASRFLNACAHKNANKSAQNPISWKTQHQKPKVSQ
jgi:hypothetical protein